MKKSFMTRALATGLSLAMAFSLTAATNVTVASAASTPAMASKQFAVRVGGATKTYKASTATRKTFKISKATVGNTSKATVTVAASKKGIKVTPGTVTGSTVVKVTFKNIKTKKSTTKKYRCVVKAAAEEEVKEYQIVSAEATGVKTISVTLNKDVTLTDAVKVSVTKGVADRNCKATANGKVITLAMDAKLIAGDYTVTIKGLETKDLTANVNVAKDETLTSFKVSSVATLARDKSNVSQVSTNSAIVTYEALNQYNERMNASTPQISCTLGTVNTTDIKDATATAAGSFTVTNIPAVMAIQGTKGTVIVVDRTTGVNANQEVTVSAAATPSTIEVAGVYNANSNKIEDLQAGANLSSGNYYILFTAKDQYENDFTDADVFSKITTTSIAGGLTNVAVDTDTNNRAKITTRTVDGKDYLAIQLKSAVVGSAKAGTYNLTIVNQEKGMLLNQSYTVADAVVIKTVNISADKGLYLGSGEQELTYDITDQNGNAVTSYAVLNNSSVMKFSNTYGRFSFKKNADGTAKLVYNPDLNGAIVPVGNDDKKSAIVTETVQANDQTSSNLIIKPMTFTVYEAKVPKSVNKLKDGTATSVALNQTLKISLGDIVYTDQYGNEMSAKDAKLDTASKVALDKATVGTGTSIYVDVQGGTITTSITDNKLQFVAGDKTATATVYLKYGDKVTASSSNYDYRFTVMATDTTGIDASSLKIKSVNGGKMKAVSVGNAATLSTDEIEVVGKIGGNDTKIPPSQYVIKSYKDNVITSDEKAKGVTTKTATVVIQVTTQDANGNRTETELTGTFKITLNTSAIGKVDSVNDGKKDAGLTAKVGTVVSAGALKALFNYKDQFDASITYTDETTAGAGSVLITADVSELPNGATASDCKIVGSGTSNISITFGAEGDYMISVKATIKDSDGNVTSEKDCIVKVSVSS